MEVIVQLDVKKHHSMDRKKQPGKDIVSLC